MRDERGEAIVVAVTNLVVGDGVVLVDDRKHAELEQPLQRRAGVQVLAPMHEVVRRQQHLPGDNSVRRENRVQALQEARLPDGGDCLERPHVGRSTLQPERRHAGGDSTGQHEDKPMSAFARGGEISAQLQERRVVELATLACDRRGADLHDSHHRGRPPAVAHSTPSS